MRTGDIIGSYRLVKPLGEGSEGSVWLGINMKTGLTWALKIFPHEGGHNELSMLMRLRHPSLPEYIDVLECDGGKCLVMEYVRGEDLYSLKQRGFSFTSDRLLDLAEKLGKAVLHMHDHKPPIYHLDIKPGNVIVTREGRAVLVDLGAAEKRPSSGAQGACARARHRGTEGFAAPEQYVNSGEVDGRADIYGLGSTLYYLSCGKIYDPLLFKSRVPGAGDDLNRLLHRCLEDDPQHRYQSAREMLKDLSGMKSSAFRRRRRMGAWTALMLAVFSVSFLSGAVRYAGNGNLPPDWDYDRILREAGCMPFPENMDLFSKAVFIKPFLGDAYVQCLEMMGRDGIFSFEEEKEIMGLLRSFPPGDDHTYEDVLFGDGEAYGEVCTLVGLLYRQCYEDRDSGRKISRGWFEKALYAYASDPGHELPEMGRIADLLCVISSLDDVSLTGEPDEKTQMVLRFWESVRELTDTDLFGLFKPIGRSAAVSLLEDVVRHMFPLLADLKEAGVTWEEIERVLCVIRGVAEEMDPMKDGNIHSMISDALLLAEMMN